MAARKPPLRAVAVGEKAPAVAPKGVVDAVRDGTTRDVLVSMRLAVARAVADPKCPPVALAALTKRLEDLTDKLVALDARAQEEAEHGGDVADEAFDASAI